MIVELRWHGKTDAQSIKKHEAEHHRDRKSHL